MTTPWCLAIDFGTSNTVAAISELDRPGRAEPLRLGDNYRMASAVMLDRHGEPLVGPQLEQEAELSPERVERRPKRQLGQSNVFIGGEWRPPIDLVKAVFSYVYREACRVHNGHPPVVTRLTHPARWQDMRKDLLLEAAHLAGMEQVTLLEEPTAAAVALVNRQRLADVAVGDRVAVYDFGGGTLDTAVLMRTERGFEMFGPPGGDEHLGGEDIDDRLVSFLAAQLPEADREALFDPEAPDAWHRAAYHFVKQVRRAKEALSERRTQRIPLMSPPLRIAYVQLAESDLVSIVGDLVKGSLNRLEGDLRRTGTTPDELAAIYLVGGSSRLAIVQRILGRRFQGFQVPIVTYDDPKALVALGAAESHLGDDTHPQKEPPEAFRNGSRRGRPVGHSDDLRPLGNAAATSSPTAVHTSEAPASTPHELAGGRPSRNAAKLVSDPQDVIPPAPAARPIGRHLVISAAECSLPVPRDDNQDVVVSRWLVTPGERVLIGQPLAELHTPGGEARAPLITQYSGHVLSLRVPQGNSVGRFQPLLDLHCVTAFVFAVGRVTTGDTGIALATEPRPHRWGNNSSAQFLDVTVAGCRPERVWWGRTFFLLLPPGTHTLTISYLLDERRRGGPASRLVTIGHGQRVALAYRPPRLGHGPGKLLG